jgi:SAM-dependent methyltransferase
MGTIEQNRYAWNNAYDWKHQGKEWSKGWGGVNMQWYGSVLPRIHAFTPTETILEIGPGFGRWTQFLKDLCDHLVVVDLSEKCLQACQRRFGCCSKITYHLNDGISLDMIPAESIDFVFSFDSLVHAEADVIETYLNQLGGKFRKNGVGFIHHSNMGEFSAYFSLLKKIPKGKVKDILARLRLIERKSHWRAHSMTAERFEKFSAAAGLQCISQEIINWGTSPKRLIDCLSMVTRKNSMWARPNRVIRNGAFMKEANYLLRLSKLYGIDFFR